METREPMLSSILLLGKDWLGTGLFLLMTSNLILSDLNLQKTTFILTGCFRMNLASGVVKENHLLRSYFKPNSVSYSRVVWFIWPWGNLTEGAEMPDWHFTSDLQPPRLEAGFISDRRLSPVKNQTVCNVFTCWVTFYVLMGRVGAAEERV